MKGLLLEMKKNLYSWAASELLKSDLLKMHMFVLNAADEINRDKQESNIKAVEEIAIGCSTTSRKSSNSGDETVALQEDTNADTVTWKINILASPPHPHTPHPNSTDGLLCDDS
ncbi:hypothetical protein PoB_005443800 [Plakobranchus ocellatus]|uniref:Uncharacterized protein n=1 Tax=Plakobranchus ocellatus TaxID=259542 RepID=A0AAV4C8V0_9GAST|nr:hypothetical protein PoB_005443800 [Plakobranchus ocellatus]